MSVPVLRRSPIPNMGATGTAPPLLSVERIWKSFGSDSAPDSLVLRDVSLSVEHGEFVTLIGPSGCGKSTLLEIIAGLQEPTGGQVLMEGSPIAGPGPDRTVVFQHYALFPWRTALENVAFPLEIKGIPKRERIARAQELLHTVQLHNVEDKYITQLSGGMQQRLGLARALACDARLLLMDEPFSGADAITREGLQDLLHKLHVNLNQTVLFVTHSVDEAMRLSDRILVFGTHPGRILSVVQRDQCLEAARDSSDAGDMRARIGALLRRELRAGPPAPDGAP